MSSKYLDVLNKVVEQNLENENENRKKEIKEIIEKLITAEKEYEFNDERPRIKALIDSLVAWGAVEIYDTYSKNFYQKL